MDLCQLRTYVSERLHWSLKYLKLQTRYSEDCANTNHIIQYTIWSPLYYLNAPSNTNKENAKCLEFVLSTIWISTDKILNNNNWFSFLWKQEEEVKRIRRYAYPAMYKQLSKCEHQTSFMIISSSWYIQVIVYKVNVHKLDLVRKRLLTLICCLCNTFSLFFTEDFQLNIVGGEFTDSEIIVMLGENGKT